MNILVLMGGGGGSKSGKAEMGSQTRNYTIKEKCMQLSSECGEPQKLMDSMKPHKEQLLVLSQRKPSSLVCCTLFTGHTLCACTLTGEMITNLGQKCGIPGHRHIYRMTVKLIRYLFKRQSVHLPI